MTTATRPHNLTTDDGLIPYNVTIRQYKKMIAAGVFPRGARIELLGGLIATKRISTTTTWFNDAPLYRFNLRQYRKMIDAGVFPEDAKVELLGGMLAAKMTKHAPHNFTVRRLADLIRGLAMRDWVVSEEKPVECGRNWSPEPDIAVARGPDDRYRTKHPVAADVGLVIEVCESSYATDRKLKWHGYAAFKIPVYWVVNIGGRSVEVYTNPAGRGKTAKYRDVKVYGEADSIPVVVNGQNLGAIAVNDFLP